MIQIAHPVPQKRDSVLKRIKQARRAGLAFKPSPSVQPHSNCYLMPVSEMANSLGVEAAELRQLLTLLGLTVLPGDHLLEPDTTLALRTAFGTRA
jgi:hypothetical protein